MNFARFMSVESIRLDLTPPYHVPVKVVVEKYADKYGRTWEDEESEDGDLGEDDKPIPPMRQIKENVMEDMANLLFASGKVNNMKRLATDLTNVAHRSTCAIGSGVAIPHLRCLHTRNMVIGFGRYIQEFCFDAIDEQDVQLFIPMIAPQYDDSLYLRVCRAIAKSFLETNVKEVLLSVQDPGEVIRVFNEYFIL